jgi:hypothetical protein
MGAADRMAELLAVIDERRRSFDAMRTWMSRWHRDCIAYQKDNDDFHRERGELHLIPSKSLPYSAPYTPERIAQLTGDLAAAVDDYIREWCPGWPIVPGFMECHGRKPNGQDGPHLRRMAHESRELDEVRPDRMQSARRSLEPELREGEVAHSSMGSRIPVIALGRIDPWA